MYPGFGAPLGSEDFPTLFLAKRTWAGKRMAMRLLRRMLYAKLTGKQLRGAGAAIQGRMLQIALREGLPIWTGNAREGFHGRGRASERRDCRRAAAATCASGRCDGVLINSGGFSHSREMREQYQPKPNP